MQSNANNCNYGGHNHILNTQRLGLRKSCSRVAHYAQWLCSSIHPLCSVMLNKLIGLLKHTSDWLPSCSTHAYFAYWRIVLSIANPKREWNVDKKNQWNSTRAAGIPSQLPVAFRSSYGFNIHCNVGVIFFIKPISNTICSNASVPSTIPEVCFILLQA